MYKKLKTIMFMIATVLCINVMLVGCGSNIGETPIEETEQNSFDENIAISALDLPRHVVNEADVVNINDVVAKAIESEEGGKHGYITVKPGQPLLDVMENDDIEDFVRFSVSVAPESINTFDKIMEDSKIFYESEDKKEQYIISWGEKNVNIDYSVDTGSKERAVSNLPKIFEFIKTATNIDFDESELKNEIIDDFVKSEEKTLTYMFFQEDAMNNFLAIDLLQTDEFTGLGVSISCWLD